MVSCGSTYYVHVVFLIPLAAVLSDVVLRSHLCFVPHSYGYSIVRCGCTYQIYVYVVYLTPMASVLSDVVQLTTYTYMLYTLLRWLHYCQT